MVTRDEVGKDEVRKKAYQHERVDEVEMRQLTEP